MTLNCESEVSYQGAKQSGGFEFLKVGAKGEHEEVAIRKVSEEVEAYMAQHRRLCEQYNACVLDKADYAERSSALGTTLTALMDGAGQVKLAHDSAAASDDKRDEYLRELAKLYRMLPEEKRSESVGFQMIVEATLPDSVGGGRVVLASGDPVPTDAKLTFTVAASKAAHAYIFQRTPSGEVNVLFPEPRINLANPLPEEAPVQIPPAPQSFRVNEKDIGLEKVHVVVSREPVDSLEEAIGKLRSEGAGAAEHNRALTNLSKVPAGRGLPDCKTRALELDEGTAPPCARPRGLELDDGTDGTPTARGLRTSMAVETEPGDDMIVKTFLFDHTTTADYAKKRAAAASAVGFDAP